MPCYFMRDTPLQALEQLMMSQPGQKPRGGGIYRSPFHYTPKDVACEYCQNYVRKHPCRLCECTCLEERIEAGVLELNSFVRDCFAPSMGSQLRKRMRQQFREKKAQFFLSDAHRRRWTHWRERCWRLSDRNKAALFLLTAYHIKEVSNQKEKEQKKPLFYEWRIKLTGLDVKTTQAKSMRTTFKRLSLILVSMT